MSEKQSGVPESYVQEKDVAEVGAYAEKPIRDAVHEYKQQLKEKYGDEEAQKTIDAMEWMASEDGEKAMATYREGQEAEDPRVRLLREKAQESIRLTAFVRPQYAAVVESQLKTIGMMQVEQILAKEVREEDKEREMTLKLEQIQILGNTLNSGVATSFGHMWPKDVMNKYWTEYGGGWSSESTVTLLKGMMVADMATGKGRRGVAALECIARMEDRSTNEVVKEHLPFIVNTKSKVSAPDRIDQGMDDLGWLWDEKTGTYISLEGEK